MPARTFATRCEQLPFDPMRVKSDLHLSLAYGLGYSEPEHLSLALEVFGGVDLAHASWRIGLWVVERGRWHLRSAAEWV